MVKTTHTNIFSATYNIQQQHTTTYNKNIQQHTTTYNKNIQQQHTTTTCNNIQQQQHTTTYNNNMEYHKTTTTTFNNVQLHTTTNCNNMQQYSPTCNNNQHLLQLLTMGTPQLTMMPICNHSQQLHVSLPPLPHHSLSLQAPHLEGMEGCGR